MKFSKISTQRILRALTVGIAVALGAFVFITPGTVKNGVVEGLRLCANIVIPSLFPFSVLSLFICMSGVLSHAPRLLGRVTGAMLGLSWNEFSVFVMSMISGYPVGARLIAEMHDRGEISGGRAKQMLMFCVNGGPSFIIIAVGSGMVGYKNAGVILFASHIAASLIICRVVTLRYGVESGGNGSSAQLPLSDCFVNAVSSASNGMFSICGWVVLFSAVCAVIRLAPLKSDTVNIICCFTEVTTGLAGSSLSIPLISFFLGFSGFSVVFQVMSAVGEIGFSFKALLLSRLAHGVLSYLVCRILLVIFPISVEVLSNGVPGAYGANSLSLPAVAALVGLMVVFAFYTSSKFRNNGCAAGSNI